MLDSGKTSALSELYDKHFFYKSSQHLSKLVNEVAKNKSEKLWQQHRS